MRNKWKWRKWGESKGIADTGAFEKKQMFKTGEVLTCQRIYEKEHIEWGRLKSKESKRIIF